MAKYPAHARAVAHVHLDRVRRNLAILVAAARERSRELVGAVPMVKCNAYGHGLPEIGRVLEAIPDVVALGVASLSEGVVLRSKKIHKPIWVFSDSGPWDESVASLAAHARLTPVFHRFEDLKAAVRTRARLEAGFHLKFNTGMNRLGIDCAKAAEVRRWCAVRGLRPQGICTHFATAEEPSSSHSRMQLELFRGVVAEFSSLDVSHIHCANTAAILEAKRLGWGTFCNVFRPGIGLYGYGGRAGRRAGLKPVLELRARVISARRLKPGALVGYGSTFRAVEAEMQALLSIGYGDGFMRRLSNEKILVRGKKVRVLGRVSMDLTSLAIRATPGTWVRLLGESDVQGEVMASAAQTIPYELLTSISSTRVPRIYIDSVQK